MRRGERGANLAEFAIVVPLMILLICGIVDVGRAFYGFIVVTNAVGEGARYGARQPNNSSSDGAIETKVLQEIGTSGALLTGCDPSVARQDIMSPKSRVVQVSVVCKFDAITPFIQGFGTGGQLTISNLARARIQGLS